MGLPANPSYFSALLTRPRVWLNSLKRIVRFIAKKIQNGRMNGQKVCNLSFAVF